MENPNPLNLTRTKIRPHPLETAYAKMFDEIAKQRKFPDRLSQCFDRFDPFCLSRRVLYRADQNEAQSKLKPSN
jgi:hypothetical protein